MKAKNEGFQAWNDGIAANPYPPASVNHRFWRDGWHKAEAYARAYGGRFEPEENREPEGQHYEPAWPRGQLRKLDIRLAKAKDITGVCERIA